MYVVQLRSDVYVCSKVCRAKKTLFFMAKRPEGSKKMSAKTYLKAKLAICLFLLIPVISGTTDFTYTQAAIEDTDNNGTANIYGSAGLFDIPVSYSVGYSPHENDAYGLATGDVDNDGLNDVVVANNHENNMGVFIQDNNGNLKQMERYATGTGSRSAAVGDINNDGLNDIVIINYWSNDMSVFLQAADGKICEPVNYDAGFAPYRVAIGDVSNDDLPDVVVIEQGAGGLSHIHIFKQNNTGLLDPKISYETGNSGSGLAVGDINNDGLNDIVTSADRSLYVFLQESDGGFERIEYPVYDYHPEYDDYDAEIENIAIGDVNNDNLNDIVTSSYDQMSIYYQNQEGGLNSPVGYPRCRDAAIGDINNDKLNDIVSVKWGISNGGNIRVFLQQDNSQFHQMEYTFGLSLRNVEINDLNNDGLNDVAVVDDNTNELGVFLQLSTGTTYHVNGVSGNNTNEGLTPETAFETIQRGINATEDGDTVLVWPGVYNDEIAFWGDAITVKSAADAAIVETNYGYAFSFFSAEGPGTVLSNFIIRNSQFGIYLINGASPTLRNLTIVNNDFGISAFNGADPDISSCIFWGNNYGDLFRDPVPLQAKYSCIEEGSEGKGNISIEPGFVDANGGDYHLLSERGRYWLAHDVWVLDDVTSPCVDGGDPTIDPSDERMPNGGRINMGAYGDSAYASMSEWPIKGDVNHDGRFNFLDVALLLDDWLEELPWTQ
jgi:parallel beta-helix repeat protein